MWPLATLIEPVVVKRTVLGFLSKISGLFIKSALIVGRNSEIVTSKGKKFHFLAFEAEFPRTGAYLSRVTLKSELTLDGLLFPV